MIENIKFRRTKFFGGQNGRSFDIVPKSLFTEILPDKVFHFRYHIIDLMSIFSISDNAESRQIADQRFGNDEISGNHFNFKIEKNYYLIL